jgi:hypothetical protein
MKVKSIVLTGDSIFDNAAYTKGEPSVSKHLGHLVAPDRDVILLAKDGATTAQISEQTRRLAVLSRKDYDVECVFLSVGGNNALQNITILEKRVNHVAGALEHVDDMMRDFERNYREALAALHSQTSEMEAKLAVSTIYDCNFNSFLKAPGRIVLALFNDVILRAASAAGVGVLDLRRVCIDPADYEMEIEPSGQGGEKIAKAISSALPFTSTV